jgi:hypothetical protein
MGTTVLKALTVLLAVFFLGRLRASEASSHGDDEQQVKINTRRRSSYVRADC